MTAETAKPPAGGSLSDEELRIMTRLLARYASHDLDQRENWRVLTEHGPVYLLLTREVPHEWGPPTPETYATLWPTPARLLPAPPITESDEPDRA